MQRHLDFSRPRHLPAAPGDSFQLEVGEPLAVGLRRLAVTQCEQAIRGLADGDELDRGIHEARKAIKRVRSILRLVRPVLGEKVYRYENDRLRDASRRVAPLRDGVVAVITVGNLADRFQGRLPIDVFDDLSERLDRRSLRLRSRVLEGDAVDRLAWTLERARVRFASWPADPAEGGRLKDRFRSIGPGLTDTYRRGRSEMLRALERPTAANFHQWRKRVKYLRHQSEILYPLWPEVMSATAFSLDRLGELLGEEHDLAQLLDLIAVDPGLAPDPVERSLFAALAQHRRAELQTGSRILGTRLFAETPERFIGRVEAYWDSTRVPVGVGMLPFG